MDERPSNVIGEIRSKKDLTIGDALTIVKEGGENK